MTNLTCPRLPFELRVVGVSFHADAVARVRVGDRVLVAHEPDNSYDANACAVMVNDELVGHAPKALAARMVSGQARAWTGTVTEVSDGGDLPTGLVISLTSFSMKDLMIGDVVFWAGGVFAAIALVYYFFRPTHGLPTGKR